MVATPTAALPDTIRAVPDGVSVSDESARRHHRAKVRLVRLAWLGVIGYLTFFLVFELAADQLLIGVSPGLQALARFGVVVVVLLVTAAGLTWRALEAATAFERAEQQVAQSERLAALGRLAAGVSHDAANTLALVAGRAEVTLDRLHLGILSPEEILAALEEMHRAAMDGAEMVRRLHHFGRPQSSTNEAVDVNATIREVAAFTRPRWRDSALAAGIEIDLVLHAEATRHVVIPAAELREALVNLVLNSVDALPTGGWITLATHDDGDQVAIEIADTGVGMPEHVRGRAFDPFFTTKGAGGTGMGLAMVHAIVTRAGGSVSVDSEPGKGTRFVLLLPAAEPLGAPQDETTVETRAARVLILDDEPGLVRLLMVMLEGAGHEVTSCTSARDALDRVALGGFDVVLSDVTMPEMSGWEVARQIKELSPRTAVALVTGWAAEVDDLDLRARGVDAVLAKPYRGVEVRALVERLIRPTHSAFPVTAQPPQPRSR